MRGQGAEDEGEALAVPAETLTLPPATVAEMLTAAFVFPPPTVAIEPLALLLLPPPVVAWSPPTAFDSPPPIAENWPDARLPLPAATNA